MESIEEQTAFESFFNHYESLLNKCKNIIENKLLQHASKFGRLNVVQHLIENTASPTTLINADSNRALRLAAEHGHFDIVEYLCNHGADISAYEHQAMRRASIHGHVEIERYLLKGADSKESLDPYIHIQNKMFLTAAVYGNIGFIKEKSFPLDIIQSDNNYAFRMAAKNGHFEVIKYIVERISETNDALALASLIHADNDSALRKAAYNNHYDIVKYLVEHGANVHACDDDAVKRAIISGHMDIIKYLIEECDANIHANNDWVIDYVYRRDNRDINEYLDSF